MRLTAQELEEMRSVDIGAVEADKLADVSGMALDHKLPLEERLALLLLRGRRGGQGRVLRRWPVAPRQAHRSHGAAEERAVKPLRRSLFRL